MGRVPSASTVNPPDPLSIELMATDGAMGRTVADVEFATRLLNGAHPRDPVSVDVSFDRAPLPRRVAGVITEPIFGPVEPAVLDGVRRAADALADDGWAIEEVTLPEFERVHEIWTRLMAADIPDLLDAVGPLITPRLAEVLLDHTTFYDPSGIRPMAIFPERLRLMARWTEVFEQTPVIVGPVLAEQAFRGGDDLTRGIDFVMRLLQFVSPAPPLALPSLAVPTGVIDGLPVGVQLQADRWNDAYCFEAGITLENKLGSFGPALPG
jgi:amidase